jgi:hypothetical protein
MLTTLPFNEQLDLQPWVGQQSSTFTFELVNGLTGEHLGFITPLRNAALTHDTSRTIKRQLTINLGIADTDTVDPLTARLLLSMRLGDGSVWPLGRYMFTDDTSTRFTSGRLSNAVLTDEMFLVDQELTEGFDASGTTVVSSYQKLLSGLNVTFTSAASDGLLMAQSWSIGSHRGQIMEALAVTGNYFSPWFGNDAALHLIRTFDPIDQVPQFDWDAGNQVLRDSIVESSNILTAPNRFVVISNTSANDPIVGIATVSVTAPNSFANRGFYITATSTLQLSDASQAQAVARGLANRLTIFETVNLTTALDPRHDSYDVIFWRDNLWLELAWGMQLTGGGKMTHTLRKAYAIS